jgi:hypothetical protein
LETFQKLDATGRSGIAVVNAAHVLTGVTSSSDLKVRARPALAPRATCLCCAPPPLAVPAQPRVAAAAHYGLFEPDPPDGAQGAPPPIISACLCGCMRVCTSAHRALMTHCCRGVPDACADVHLPRDRHPRVRHRPPRRHARAPHLCRRRRSPSAARHFGHRRHSRHRRPLRATRTGPRRQRMRAHVRDLVVCGGLPPPPCLLKENACVSLSLSIQESHGHGGRAAGAVVWRAQPAPPPAP